MRQRRLVAAASAGAALLLVLGPSANAARPPAGAADPAKMVLQLTDFTSAKVDGQGYQETSEGVESEYERDFADVVYKGHANAFALSSAIVGSSIQETKTAYAVLSKQLATKGGRAQFAAGLEEAVGSGAK